MFKNEFSKFQHDSTDHSLDYNDKEAYMVSLTEDGIIAYAMQHSKISNNTFINWGHASINIDATVVDSNWEPKGMRDISYNEIFNNMLTSPDTEYGGRIVVDDAHDNIVYDNKIINTSIESQLNGYNNKYTDNIFKNTKFPNKFSDPAHASVIIEAYGHHGIENNLYHDLTIINTVGNVGLKVFKQHAIHDNNYTGNAIQVKDSDLAILYYDNYMSASDFNTNDEAYHGDRIYGNEDINSGNDFDFGGCQGSGTFEQQIHKYQNYEDAAIVGEIPEGIKGLKVSLISNKDVDI